MPLSNHNELDKTAEEHRRESVQQPRMTYVIPNFDATGPWRGPYQICGGFVRRGWDVKIVALASAQNRAIDRVWQKIPVQKVDGRSLRLRQIRLFLRLLGRRNSEVVFAVVWHRYCIALAFSKLLWGNPYVVWLDGYTHRASWDAQGWWARIRAGLKYGLPLRFADLVLADAPICFDHTRKYFPHTPTLLVPPCLWESELRQIERRWQVAGWQGERQPIILFTGRIVPRKNLHDLVEAFISLADKYPDWKLELRGPVEDAAYYGELVARIQASGMAGRIRLESPLFGEELYKRYRCSSIYCLPSTGEAVPTTILEAMYFGGAIVAGNSGHVGYMLDGGRCGYLFNPGNVEQLVSRLDRLMGDEREREALMKRARERLIAEFTWERYFDQIEQHLRRVLKV